MSFLFFHYGEGMGCVNSQASGEVKKEKLSGKRFKIFFVFASTYARKKKNNVVQNGTVLVFILF